MEVLRYIKEALTRNWGLKLLALGLAVVIYHSMKTEGTGSHKTKANDRNILQEQR